MNTIENWWYRISAKALIYNDKGEFLLCKENNWLWDLPWWWLDHLENPIDCIKRELKEEMWLEAIEIGINPEYFITAHKPESRTRPWIANVCYRVKVKNLDFIPSDECVEIWFFGVDTISTIKTFVNITQLTKQMKLK
jgi:ADP-ribose pyrophosphatase YjhB (NUDIX family)